MDGSLKTSETMSAHFAQGLMKGVKQQNGSPRNNPFFVMLARRLSAERAERP
jgi:hypothetical protein